MRIGTTNCGYTLSVAIRAYITLLPMAFQLPMQSTRLQSFKQSNGNPSERCVEHLYPLSLIFLRPGEQVRRFSEVLLVLYFTISYT